MTLYLHRSFAHRRYRCTQRYAHSEQAPKVLISWVLGALLWTVIVAALVASRALAGGT